MTRSLFPAFAPNLTLAALLLATGVAPGLAPGLAVAADSSMTLEVDAIQYFYCTVNGGEEIWEEGDDVRICQYSDGTEIWCDADYSDCEFVLPAPGGQASTSTSTTGSTTQAPGGASGGGFGGSTGVTGTLQLEFAQ